MLVFWMGSVMLRENLFMRVSRVVNYSISDKKILLFSGMTHI